MPSVQYTPLGAIGIVREASCYELFKGLHLGLTSILSENYRQGGRERDDFLNSVPSLLPGANIRAGPNGVSEPCVRGKTVIK